MFRWLFLVACDLLFVCFVCVYVCWRAIFYERSMLCAARSSSLSLGCITRAITGVFHSTRVSTLSLRRSLVICLFVGNFPSHTHTVTCLARVWPNNYRRCTSFCRLPVGEYTFLLLAFAACVCSLYDSVLFHPINCLPSNLSTVFVASRFAALCGAFVVVGTSFDIISACDM